MPAPEATLAPVPSSGLETGDVPTADASIVSVARPTAAGGTTAAGAGADLDELARRLYDPLSARLRAELWLDRERTGRSLTR